MERGIRIGEMEVQISLPRSDGTEIRLGNFIAASFCLINIYDIPTSSMNYSNYVGKYEVGASKQQDLNSCNT